MFGKALLNPESTVAPETAAPVEPSTAKGMASGKASASKTAAKIASERRAAWSRITTPNVSAVAWPSKTVVGTVKRMGHIHRSAVIQAERIVARRGDNPVAARASTPEPRHRWRSDRIGARGHSGADGSRWSDRPDYLADVWSTLAGGDVETIMPCVGQC